MGFRQPVQTLERITPITSTLQDKQNELSFYGFSSTGSKARMNNTNHLNSNLQDKEMNLHSMGFHQGGTPIYCLYGYVLLERVWFLSYLVWYRV